VYDLRGLYSITDLGTDEMTIINFIRKKCEKVNWIHVARNAIQRHFIVEFIMKLLVA
jgi:hypothetical protein